MHFTFLRNWCPVIIRYQSGKVPLCEFRVHFDRSAFLFHPQDLSRSEFRLGHHQEQCGRIELRYQFDQLGLQFRYRLLQEPLWWFKTVWPI